ncbi:hypothetical protein NPIL_328552 [Nephila pilipes]|uniref:Uncharacterized protein n=1 Tax=Nephila pilipes TaxID=299642 RepID=A0A8X6T751_NEPPI|nr:hypothetical protein NPIL_328552 [Nephila pilipes]
MSESSKRRMWKMRFTGKLLKSAIFIVCVGCFSWQSADFLQLYLTYPTATSVDVNFPEVLIKPAVTICSSNPDVLHFLIAPVDGHFAINILIYVRNQTI